MDPLTLGMLGSLAVNGIATGISAYNAKKDRETNKDVARENLAYQQQNLDYQRAIQQQIFQREDTAVQRRKSDLLAAGMNPYLSATQPGAGAGSVVSTSAPHNDFQSTLSRDMASVSKGLAETPGQVLDAISAIQKVKQDSLYTKYMEIQNKMALLGLDDARNNFILDWAFTPDGNKYHPFNERSTKNLSGIYDLFKQTNQYKQRELMLNNLAVENQLREKDVDFYVADRIEKYLMDSITGFSKYSFTKNYRRR